MPTPDPASGPLTRLEKAWLAAFALLIVAHCGLILYRSALSDKQRTDLTVYARTGYAVRAGLDIYAVKDDRGCMYCYPPPFAVLMAPLGDPYPGDDRSGYLPFAATVVLWYVLSVGFLAGAMLAMGSTALPDAARGGRRWWHAWTVPVYFCLGGIGSTLSHGQVGLLLIGLLAGVYVCLVRGRALASGVWLAAAVALKVIPAFLLLFPLVCIVRFGQRWAGRFAVGFALGLVGLLGVLPAAVWGVEGAVRNDLRVLDSVLIPGATGEGDQARATTLTNTTATRSQSFQAVIHAVRHPDPATRPAVAERSTRLAHWAIAGVMTLVTVLVGLRRLRAEPSDQLVYFGCLCVLMVLMCPVAHAHYYALALPLLTGLHARGQLDRPGQVATSGGMIAVSVIWGVMTGVILVPSQLPLCLREVGLGTAATVGLWAFGLAVVARH